MAEEVELKRVYVSLETRGDVRPGLQDAERAAEESQRRLQRTAGGGQQGAAGGQQGAPVGYDRLQADLLRSVASQQSRSGPSVFQSAVGALAMQRAMSPFAQHALQKFRQQGISESYVQPSTLFRPLPDVIARLAAQKTPGGEASRQSIGRIEAELDAKRRATPAQLAEVRKQWGQADAAKERSATEREKTATLGPLVTEARLKGEGNRVTGLFNRSVTEAGRGLDSVSRSLTGMGGLGRILGAAGPFGAAAAGFALQVETANKAKAMIEGTVALRDPGRAYRLQRAQADLGASLGEGLKGAHDEITRATRGAADFVAAHPQTIATTEKIARQLTFGPLGTYGPKILEWLGKGNEGKSNNMAIHPDLGKFFGSGDDLYKAIAQHAIMGTAANEGGGAGGAADKQVQAAGTFEKAVQAFQDIVTALMPGGAGVIAGKELMNNILK